MQSVDLFPWLRIHHGASIEFAHRPVADAAVPSRLLYQFVGRNGWLGGRLAEIFHSSIIRPWFRISQLAGFGEQLAAVLIDAIRMLMGEKSV